MLNVPFPKAVLDAQVRIEYDNDKYRVCIGGEIIGTYSFCLSVAKDFDAIESCIDEHVTKNPHLLRFYSNAGDSDACLISIPNGEHIVTDHIKQWCYNWNISLIDLMDLNAIVEKFGNDTGKLNLIPTRTNDGYLNGRIHYTSGTNYNLTGTGTVSTTDSFFVPQSQRNYSLSVAFNMNTQLQLSYAKPKVLTDAMLPISQDDIQHATVSLAMLRHKFLPLFTLSGINPKLRYLFKDILNMSKAKYSYFVECVDEILKSGINEEYMADIAAFHGVDIGQMHRQRLEVMAKDNPIIYRVLHHRSEVVRELIDKLPKFVEDYPFPSGYAIPNISAKPQTPFQWAITNQLAKRKISIQDSLQKLDMTFIKDVKENTKLLLPGIHADDKALLMFLKYRGMLDEEGNYKKGNRNARVYSSSESMDNDTYVYGMSHSDLIDECNKMLDLIKDGVDLYERYPNPIEVEDYGVIRLSPVKGTMLKQVRNAIFNHRIEAKITLDQRLKALRESGNEDDLMKYQVELPESLEQYRIKYKTELITIGKIMGHCIGNYTNSDNYFFRKDTVCAEVNSKTLKVKQCYDKKNTTTEDSSEFKNWLNDQFIIWWATQHQELTESLEFDMEAAEEQGNIQQLRALFEKLGPKNEYSTVFGGVDNAIIAGQVIGGRDQVVYGYNNAVAVAGQNNYHRIDEDAPMENPYEGQQANTRNIRQMIQAGELAPIQLPDPIELPINNDFNIM